MKLKLFSLLLFPVLILNFWAGPCLAWKLSPELAKEIEEKQKAVEENPNDPHAHFDLAITYAYSNRVEEGWEELRKVPEIYPDFPTVGLDMYIKKVKRDPTNWKLRFRLAFALYFNDFKKEAIKEFEKIIREDPENIWAYGYIATIYGEMGDVNKGIEYARKALSIDSNVAVLHYLLAQGYYKNDMAWQGFWEMMEALRLKALGY